MSHPYQLEAYNAVHYLASFCASFLDAQSSLVYIDFVNSRNTHRPSSKGTKLLLPVLKAIINQYCLFSMSKAEPSGRRERKVNINVSMKSSP